MKDRELLIWIHERLEFLGDHPLNDYMHNLRSIICNTDKNAESPSVLSNSLAELKEKKMTDFKDVWYSLGYLKGVAGKDVESEDCCRTIEKAVRELLDYREAMLNAMPEGVSDVGVTIYRALDDGCYYYFDGQIRIKDEFDSGDVGAMDNVIYYRVGGSEA